MTSSRPEIDDAFLNRILAIPNRKRQTTVLIASGLYNEDGLAALLEQASRLIQRDPGRARFLAILCSTVGDELKSSRSIAHADYLQAQIHAAQGEFDDALRFIESSRQAYLTLGMMVEALRVNIGLMNIHCESGRYQEAFSAGQTILNAVESVTENDPILLPADATLLAALAYQNMGVCYRRQGRYEDANNAYTQAEEYFREIDMLEPIGHLSVNRAMVLIDLGQAREALDALETAVIIFTNANHTRMQAKALNNMGLAHQLLGSYDRSLENLEQARRLFDTFDAQAERQILLLDIARIHLSLNLYPEALTTYQEAAVHLEQTGMQYHLAHAQWGIGIALAAQRNIPAAENALSRAADLFAAAENMPYLSGVMLEQSALLIAQNQHGAALQKAQDALQLVAGSEWSVQLVYALLRVSDLLLSEDMISAELLLQEAQEIVDKLMLPHLRYRVNQRLGHLRLQQGQDEEAEALLLTAVTDIERLRQTLTHEAIRASFLQDKIAAYEDLIQLYLQREDEASLQRAFAIAEQAKSRTLIDLLMGLAETKLDTEDLVLAERLRSLKADLTAIYNESFNSGTGGERHARQSDLYARALLLENEIRRLWLQVAATPAAATFLPQPEFPELTAPHTQSGTIVFTYHIIGDEVMVFVHKNDRLHTHRHLGNLTHVQQLLNRLSIQWAHFRAGDAFAKRHMHHLTLSAQRILRELYQVLIAPLEGYLSHDEIAHLLVIPHGVLHQAPFHAFFDGQVYLIDRLEVAYAPSVTLYNLCQQQTPRQTGKSLIFGVLDDDIPFVEKEAKALVTALPNAKLFVNEQATIDALHQEAANGNIIHIACHGIFRQDNPMFSALKLYNGWLTATSAMQLSLDGALVTLSACESGRSQIVAGDEILGLTRAFLGAGAATLVVSLWLAADETTAAYMMNWYEQMKHQPTHAAALRAATLAVKTTHPHPYYWAPFILIGQS